MRTLFPGPVPPGGDRRRCGRVFGRPVKPGRFRLLWDIEQQDQLWFSSEPKAVLVETDTSVSGPLVATLPISRIQFMPHQQARPGRAVLWRAALRMIAAHPLTGVGPDNFRLDLRRLRGHRQCRLPCSQQQHVSRGRCRHRNPRRARVCSGSRGACRGRILALCLRGDRTLGAGVAAAAVAIAAHGIVDAFLGFTATYILIAITLGLAVASSSMGEAHAHRV